MRASRPRARPYGERTLGDFTENRTHRLHRNVNDMLLRLALRLARALGSHGGERDVSFRVGRSIPRCRRGGGGGRMEPWPRPPARRANEQESTAPSTKVVLHLYFIQRKADSRNAGSVVYSYVALAARLFFSRTRRRFPTRRRARLGGSPLPRSVCSRRCLGCAAWSSLRTRRASGRPRTCTRTARR